MRQREAQRIDILSRAGTCCAGPGVGTADAFGAMHHAGGPGRFPPVTSSMLPTPVPSTAPPRARPVAVRVTHVVHDLQGGGLESVVGAMACRLDPTRIATCVVSLSGRPGRIGRTISSHVEAIIALRPIPGVSMIVPLALVRALRRTRPDVVHVHSGVWYKGALAARIAGVPAVVATEHGREHDDPSLARWLDRRAAAWSDIVVPVSPRLHAYLREHLGIPPDRLLTIENGVDATHFAPAVSPLVSAAMRARFGIPLAALVIGSVGRLDAVKGYDRLLRAASLPGMATLCDAPVHLLLGGDGEERAPLQRLAEALGIRERTHFAGWVDDPADLYRAMDLFVLPSHSEGLSVSLLEAMATEVPVLVTAVGSNPEVLGPELASQLVDAADPQAFAQAVARTMDPEARRVVAARGRARVLGRYSQAQMLDAYTSLYERLAARLPGQAPRPLAPAGRPTLAPASRCRT